MIILKVQIASNKLAFLSKKMKRLCNIALGILISTTIIIVVCCTFYNYQLSPVSSNNEIIEIEIPNNTSTKKIATILKENKLIRDEKIFLIYVKLMKAGNMKAGYYDFSQDMGVKTIVSSLQEGSKKNPNEIEITFKEGITMRDIAKVISTNTSNSYDSVIEKASDITYIDSLIDKYWFITDDIKNEDIYYMLEGYLFPDTYRFNNKDVSVEEIFNKMINEMAGVLEPYKTDIEKSSLSIHQILTLASMVEKEAATEEVRGQVASVFMNRIKVGMSLGSDVTTRYAFKIDNPKQVLTKVQYNTSNPYNTRVTDGSMNGRLPVGPICTLSKSSIKASIYPSNTNYLYFIANIKTLETFFYSSSSGFEQKKVELQSVNGGF